jgi:8-oxo-dGTP pyrophosphatase MutT (NUDIX family)
MTVFPAFLVKIAKSYALKQLIEAKRLSDKNDYAGKNEILGSLMLKYPKQFKVDSVTNDKYVGLTHKPSGFRIHAPKMLIPLNVEKRMTQKIAAQERVRVVLPYKGQYLLEKLNNPQWPANIGKVRHIGGGIEKGETPIQAAARELNEEIGVHVNPNAFRHLGKHDGQHYLELTEHNIQPGNYNSTFGSDPIITLEHASPFGANYIGPDMRKLYNK